MTGLTLQRERDVASGFGRFIDPENELERLSSCSPIDIGICLTTKYGQHISIVALMTESVDVRRRCVDVPRKLVVRVAVRKFPVLDLVHGSAADLHRSLLAG